MSDRYFGPILDVIGVCKQQCFKVNPVTYWEPVQVFQYRGYVVSSFCFCKNSVNTHTHTLYCHTHTHTLYCYTHTHTHTLLLHTHTHTHTHTLYCYTHTHKHPGHQVCS